MASESLLVETAGGVGIITMNKPDVHNAFDDALIDGMTAAFKAMSGDPLIRAVILKANGKSFSAGADLGWMKRMAGYSEQDNLRDAMALALLMETIDTCAKPVIGLVAGPAYGGGVGLVACCDIALATPDAAFCLSEVRLGLIPAVISPYVVRAIGDRAARRWFLTAERFDAKEAWRLGLVHQLVATDKMAAEATRLTDLIVKNGPAAVAAAKDLIRVVGDSPMGPDVMRYTARRIADIRASEEGKEGISAFLEKRKPGWVG
ncbi:MAG: enoyl-CoA hydratase/isomerase family protein [Alphaproteobacteria bacterium]|nr:enoyl-CoA hydratase/isomerase family protein [Alphaproteobacteria bacterium]